MALKKVKGNFERMFDKNLTDLVRGIRNNKDNEVLICKILSIFAQKCIIMSNTHNPATRLRKIFLTLSF